MEGYVVEYADRVAEQFLDPRKRVFLGYLGSALLIALAVQWIVLRNSGGALAGLFSPRIWWSRSARADYRIAVLN